MNEETNPTCHSNSFVPRCSSAAFPRGSRQAVLFSPNHIESPSLEPPCAFSFTRYRPHEGDKKPRPPSSSPLSSRCPCHRPQRPVLQNEDPCHCTEFRLWLSRVQSDPSSKMRQFRYFCSLAFVVESDPSSDTCLTCWCPVLKLLAMSLAAALSLLIICSRKNSPAL